MKLIDPHIDLAGLAHLQRYLRGRMREGDLQQLFYANWARALQAAL